MKVLYSPQRCNGFDLSDGEVMERMWSYLRHYGQMTKEMRPSHRTDVLVHALLYYGYMTKCKLRKCSARISWYTSNPIIVVLITAKLLVQRWNKATKLKLLAAETFKEMCSKTHGTYFSTSVILMINFVSSVVEVTDELVSRWLDTEKSIIVSSGVQTTSKLKTA